MVELVYKFDAKCNVSVRKGESAAKKCHSNFWGVTYIYIYNILGHTHNDAQVVPRRKLSSEIPRYVSVCINLYEWV